MTITKMSKSRMISAIDDSIIASNRAYVPLLGGPYIIDRYVDLYFLAFPKECELYRLAHTHLFELISQIGHTPNCLTIRTDDNIAKGSSAGIDTTEACARSRRPRNRADDDDSLEAQSGGHGFVRRRGEITESSGWTGVMDSPV